MKMMSNGWLWARLTASLPFLHTTTSVTISLSMAAMSLRLAALSSTASTLTACTRRGVGAGSGVRLAASGESRACSSLRWLMGLERQWAAPWASMAS
ncbi:hypothetical protein D3C84_754050 [compost metagenome]